MKTIRVHPRSSVVLCLFLTATLATAAPPAKPASSSSNQKSKIPNPQSSISSYTTTRYGLGTRTTDTRTGQSWTTTPYGNGARTTGPVGSSYTTTRYGHGTRTTGTGTPPPVVPALPKK